MRGELMWSVGLLLPTPLARLALSNAEADSLSPFSQDCDKVLSGSYLMRDDGPDAGGEKTYCGECYDIRAKNE